MTSPTFNYDAWKAQAPRPAEEHNPMCGCPACDPDAAMELLREDIRLCSEAALTDWEPEDG